MTLFIFWFPGTDLRRVQASQIAGQPEGLADVGGGQDQARLLRPSDGDRHLQESHLKVSAAQQRRSRALGHRSGAVR
jgi:hypothetical protein